VTAVLVGAAALTVYLLPGLPDPAAHWPLWDVRVYAWGGRQAAAGGGALYAPGDPFSFTYPPFAAVLFAACAAFALTVAAGFAWLPGWSRAFWLGGLFYDQRRVGDPANPSDQSLSGAVARLAGTGDPPRVWWLVAVLAATGVRVVRR
jgi:hypothetical protein